MRTPTATTHHGWTTSPIGRIVVLATDDAVCGIGLADHPHGPVVPAASTEGGPIVEAAIAQLDEYLAGRRRTFELPLALEGTDFQQRVWSALLAVPFGQTASYRAIAEAIDQPTAVRAVGAANGRNPVSIVVPCHRVIGADGTLTGYGWGTDAKRWLLDHEAAGRA